MKKKSFLLSFLILFALLALVGCKKHPSGETLSKVTLNEVAHSIFYAPQYVAIQEGYFAEEGIDLNFLVAREEDPDFSWQDLKGKKVLGGRKGGMPEMVFEYILKKNNLDPATDLSIDQSIDFGSTAAAFSGGQGDYTVEFEPSATALEQEGSGYVVASLGVDSGYVPYTAYCAKSSYLKESPQIIQGFTNALQKGMDYVHAHTPAEIAQVIKPQFDDTDMETLTAIVKRYQEQDTWKDSLIFEKDSFLLLSDILESAGELSEKVPYEQLVTTDFAKKAASH